MSARLLVSPSSARAQANSDTVSGDVLLQWTAELIDPPPRRKLVEHQPLVGQAATVA